MGNQKKKSYGKVDIFSMLSRIWLRIGFHETDPEPQQNETDTQHYSQFLIRSLKIEKTTIEANLPRLTNPDLTYCMSKKS